MEIKDILLKHLYVIYDSTTSEDLVIILKELYGTYEQTQSSSCDGRCNQE